MLKPLFLKVHGWLAVLFSIPLLVLCVTGLILAIEPIIQHASVEPGSLNAEEIKGYLQKYDPEGKARGLSYRAYENSLTIDGAGPDGEVEVDLLTREPSVEDGGWYWSNVFRYNRRLHEHMTVAGVDLTIASTVVMLVVIVVGVFMGLPRLRNSVSGWHKGVAWFLLPLLFLSPLTGLFLPLNIQMNPTAGAPLARSQPLPLVQAIEIVGKSHDLANMVWLRQRGGRQMVRLWDGAEARSYAITKDGLQVLPRNVSRALHEGNILGMWSGIVEVIVAAALSMLIVTGVWLFGSKQYRKFHNRRARAARAAGAPAE